MNEKASHQRLHIIEFPLHEISRVEKSMEAESRLEVFQGWGQGETGVEGSEVTGMRYFQGQKIF